MLCAVTIIAREGEALFKRGGGALEFQEDRGGDNSLAPSTELSKRQTLRSLMVPERSIGMGE